MWIETLDSPRRPTAFRRAPTAFRRAMSRASRATTTRLEAMRQRRREIRAVRALRGLDQRMLNDIGLNHSNIESAVRTGRTGRTQNQA